MVAKIFSFFQPNTTTPSTDTTANRGKCQGRSVVVVDSSYQERQPIEAGIYWDRLFSTLLTAAIVFAGVIAGLAVGIATGSLGSAFVACGSTWISAALFNVFCLKIDPHF